MLVTVVVNILNIIGNYSLIFGRFGFPELGVEGAAISTAFSRGVSMILLFIILFRKHIHRFPVAYFRPFPWIELKNLMKIGLPSAGEQLSYSSSQVVITFFINMLGVEALATRTYCVNIIMFAYLFSISMAQGGAICIGHLIGEKKPHAAFLMGKYVMKKSVMITVILSEPPSSSSTSFLKSDVPSIFSQQMPCVPPGMSPIPSMSVWLFSGALPSAWATLSVSLWSGESAVCGSPSCWTRTSVEPSS